MLFQERHWWALLFAQGPDAVGQSVLRREGDLEIQEPAPVRSVTTKTELHRRAVGPHTPVQQTVNMLGSHHR